jgi:hypothetical protein
VRHTIQKPAKPVGYAKNNPQNGVAYRRHALAEKNLRPNNNLI